MVRALLGSRYLTTVSWLLAAGCANPTAAGNIVGADSLSFGLQFTTYLGGSGIDMVRDVAIDQQGNIYAAGSTQSANFPTTPGVLQPAYDPAASNRSDAFITKLDPTGHVIWSTFLGGPGYERIYAMEVDELGFVYVAGRAGPGFPVTSGAFQTTFGGDINPQGAYGPEDGFVCKISPDGSQIVFCSYFGNEDYQPVRDLAIDANHDIYVGSAVTLTGNFPAAWFANAFQKTVSGSADALVAKIKGDGSAVEWATFVGGTGQETVGISIRADATGVYFLTTTKSADMPTPNGFGHTLQGVSDVYAAKLSPDGASLVYGTYVGGGAGEGTETHHLAIDGQGGAILAIAVPFADFSIPSPAFQPRGSGKSDILIVRIAPGGQLAAQTFIGGGDSDWAEGVAVDAAGNVYLTGATHSANFPITGGDGPTGGGDLIGVGLSPDLKRLLFSRRLGGDMDDSGRAVAVTGSTFVVAGMTSSRNWPARAAAQASFGGDMDGVIATYTRVP